LVRSLEEGGYLSKKEGQGETSKFFISTDGTSHLTHLRRISTDSVFEPA
jgi:hypothetical protein